MPSFAYGCAVCEVEVDPETGRGRGRPVYVDRRLRPGGEPDADPRPDATAASRRASARRCGKSASTIRDGPAAVRLADGLRDAAGRHAAARSGPRSARCRRPPTRSACAAAARAASRRGSAAVVNAIVDALAEFGVEHIELPATPERVWQRHPGRAAACVIPVMPHESAARPTGCSRRDLRGRDVHWAGRGGLGDSVQPLAAYHARDRRRARELECRLVLLYRTAQPER